MSQIQIALLRAINIGSHKRVSMSDLRALADDVGFTGARTVLNSGNLVFGSPLAPAQAERTLESEAKARLGLETEFMVRSAAQWRSIVARNPFPDEAARDPGRLLVMVCKTAPGKALKITGARNEVVRALGREIFIVYPDGVGRSKLKLSVLGTARNWNTVSKLNELASS